MSCSQPLISLTPKAVRSFVLLTTRVCSARQSDRAYNALGRLRVRGSRIYEELRGPVGHYGRTHTVFVHLPCLHELRARWHFPYNGTACLSDFGSVDKHGPVQTHPCHPVGSEAFCMQQAADYSGRTRLSAAASLHINRTSEGRYDGQSFFIIVCTILKIHPHLIWSTLKHYLVVVLLNVCKNI